MKKWRPKISWHTPFKYICLVLHIQYTQWLHYLLFYYSSLFLKPRCVVYCVLLLENICRSGRHMSAIRALLGMHSYNAIRLASSKSNHWDRLHAWRGEQAANLAELRRRSKTEIKAKVVAVIWGTYLNAALTILQQGCFEQKFLKNIYFCWVVVWYG